MAPKAPFLVALLVLSSCTTNPQAARVGEYSIRAQDVIFRDRVNRIYFPKDQRSLGLAQLERAYTLAQILKNNRHPLTPEKILDESRRIDRTTLMPAMLAEIKRVFGKDEEAYRRVFIVPELVDNELKYGFFLKDPAIQSPTFAVAARFLEKAKAAPAKFAELASREGVPLVDATVSEAEGIQLDALKRREKILEKQSAEKPLVISSPVEQAIKAKLEQQAKAAAEMTGARWVREILPRLQPGQVFPQVIEEVEQWRVVRYLGPERGHASTHRLEIVFFPKADFGKWLESEKAKVQPLG